MINYECFSDWAWGHIEDCYGINENHVINYDHAEFVADCAKEVLFDLSTKEQEEIFGFTLDQVINGNLLERLIVDSQAKAAPNL
jgi:hypothetical protein